MVRRQHGNSQEHVTKHIFVTGGVVSSLGKGLTASSLGRLLRSRGIKVLQQKLDPYINVDPGTMNPFQHGEVYVTEDGAETSHRKYQFPWDSNKNNFSYIVAESEQDCNEKNHFSVD